MTPIAPITTHLKYRRRHQQAQRRRSNLYKIGNSDRFEQILKKAMDDSAVEESQLSRA